MEKSKTDQKYPCLADILISALLSVLSAVSLTVFHYLRSCEDAASYYASSGKNLVQDALSADYLWIYMIVAVLLSVFYFLVRRKFRQDLAAGWFVSLPLAFNMIISLSVEHVNPWYAGNKGVVSIEKDPEFHQIEYANLRSFVKMRAYWFC